MSYTAVIVESPAKCKKIEGFLGPGYKVMASYGHIRTLSGLKSIDTKNNFRPTYNTFNDTMKSKHLDMLRRFIQGASDVLLASDDDREGEAIAWHICDLFKLPVETTKRIIFHEITETAIKNAVKSPTTLNMTLVYAQQARQILDLIVGYKISPLLWNNIVYKNSSGLSAGRCQTPALRLIYENEQEIKESPGKKVYNTTGYFTSNNIPFVLNYNWETSEDVVNFLKKSVNYEHKYSYSDLKEVSKQSPTPFTTSSLQQSSSNELRLSPKQTMDACQKLYEAGYITYMRTDSRTYSKEFIHIIKEYINKKYGELYPRDDILTLSERKADNGNISKQKTTKTTKNIATKDIKQAQEAHEAIRPTNIYTYDIKQNTTLTNRESRVYKLIRRNTLESCICSAKYNSFVSKVTAPLDKEYKHNIEQIIFPGWKIVSGYEKETPNFSYLQKIKQNSIINYKKITSKVSMKELKTHYTEARLVQLLEQKGIGRPSTFSSLVDKIQNRGYVKKDDIQGISVECVDYELESDTINEISNKREFGGERNKLIIQPLGNLVIEFLIKNFEDIFNYEYTKTMEDTLDMIAKGEYIWHELCRNCLTQIDKTIKPIKKMNKETIKIDDEHTYVVARYGPVIKQIKDGTTKFLKVKNNIDLDKLRSKEYSLEEIVEEDDIGENKSTKRLLGEVDEMPVYLNNGRFGIYLEWGDIEKTRVSLGKIFTADKFNNIKLEEVQEYLIKSKSNIRELTKNASIRIGKFGPYVYYKTEKMTKPKFISLKKFQFDYEKCDLIVLKEWLKTKHKISI